MWLWYIELEEYSDAVGPIVYLKGTWMRPRTFEIRFYATSDIAFGQVR